VSYRLEFSFTRLEFQAASRPYWHIAIGGGVGIRTSAPDGRLHVTGGSDVSVRGGGQNQIRPDLPRRARARRVRATFPAGTVSGAPKIRAMQMIADLAPRDTLPSDANVRAGDYPTGRESTTRRPHGGCVGNFSLNGNLDTCLAIRTALGFPHDPHPACSHPLPLQRARDNVQAGRG
jgi:hypothetical protein